MCNSASKYYFNSRHVQIYVFYWQTVRCQQQNDNDQAREARCRAKISLHPNQLGHFSFLGVCTTPRDDNQRDGLTRFECAIDPLGYRALIGFCSHFDAGATQLGDHRGQRLQLISDKISESAFDISSSISATICKRSAEFPVSE